MFKLEQFLKCLLSLWILDRDLELSIDDDKVNPFAEGLEEVSGNTSCVWTVLYAPSDWGFSSVK